MSIIYQEWNGTGGRTFDEWRTPARIGSREQDINSGFQKPSGMSGGLAFSGVQEKIEDFVKVV
jgi:hypothetical protein